MAVVAVTTAIFSGACVTSTAHYLPIANNPLRDDAIACEAACRTLIKPAAAPPARCVAPYVHATCPSSPPPPSRSDYARCLDQCPGARAVDGTSCPDPPMVGLICETTHKANAGGIVGGTVAVGAVGGMVLFLAALASSPVWLVVLLFAAAG